MPFVVTGISQDGNTDALETALTAAGLALDAFEVLEPEDAESAVEGSGLVDTDTLTGGLETGTGVPGLTGSDVPGAAFPASRAHRASATSAQCSGIHSGTSSRISRISRFPTMKSRTTPKCSKRAAASSPITATRITWRRSRVCSAARD